MQKKYEVIDRSLGLLRNRSSKVYYFRKYVTGVGRAEISLRTTDRQTAEREIFRLFSQFIRTPKKQELATTIDVIIADIYEINQGKSKATFEDFESHCRLHILPYFNGYPIDKVAQNWPKYVAFQHQKSPKRQLGHDRKHLIRIFNRAVERGDLAGVPKLKLDRAKRMRQVISLYSKSEVQMILNANRNDFPEFKQATLEKLKLQFELSLFSGMRIPKEVNSLQYSRIDWNQGTATLPAEVTKTREGRTYPIEPQTLEKLLKLRKRAKGDFVFPLRGDPNQPAGRTDKSWQRFKKALGLNKKRYWARHTHATELVDLGASAVAVKRNMGTSLEMLERVYYQPKANLFNRQAKTIRERFSGRTIGEISEVGGCRD